VAQGPIGNDSTLAGDDVRDKRALQSARAFEDGQLIAGRYRIVRLIACGGMGEVYEAFDQAVQETVALKSLRREEGDHETRVARLRRELQLARKVTHPNVCRVFDVGSHAENGRDTLFFTMELLAGETLAARLAREQRLPDVGVVKQIVAALAAAHDVGVTHRDVKPANIILAGERVVVTDFGLARSDEEGDTLTREGAVLGTPAYMAPEQWLGGRATNTSDIYSLGLVLYAMATGTAISARTPLPITPPSKLVPGLDRSWDAAVLGCLAKEPSARFADVRQVTRALERRPARGGVLTAAGLVAAGALAVAGAMALRSQSAPTPAQAAAAPAAPDASVWEALWNVPVGDAPHRGAAQPLVTLVEYGDFECPYTAMIETGLRKSIAEHPDTIALYWKDFPLDMHPNAMAAAALAREARAELGDDGFWRAHDRLTEMCSTLDDPHMRALAAELGLDAARVDAALTGARDREINAEMIGGEDVGVAGTPTFFVNGHTHYLSDEDPAPVLARAEAEARELLATGVPRAHLYERIIAGGRRSVPYPRIGDPNGKNVLSVIEPAMKSGAHPQVVVIEFCDVTDAKCKLEEEAVTRLRERYGDQINFQWWDFARPDDPASLRAAMALRQAFDEKGHDGHFRMRACVLARGPEMDALLQCAAEVGLDGARMRVALDGRTEEANVRALLTNARADGVKEVPSFAVSGLLATGVVPYRQLERMLQRARP
jgi:protein-disulfide isomerase/tRNA A-37 threonylcarbamoyl transferase component Bud32